MSQTSITREQFQRAKKIFFSGIGGIGMSGLAQLLHRDGVEVLGSDYAESRITTLLRDQGIVVTMQEHMNTIPQDVDMAIFSDAIPANHPERAIFQERHVPSVSYFEALGFFQQKFHHTIAIAGAHGKTTTTAMMAHVLIAAGMKPTALVGSIVSSWKTNILYGDQEWFVVEACEHQAHMLHLSPSVIVVTNIDEDHLDFYRDLAHIQQTFQEFVGRLTTQNIFVRNGDDPKSVVLHSVARTTIFGFSKTVDIHPQNIMLTQTGHQFQVGNKIFSLNIPGRIHIANALAVIGACRALGITEDAIIQGLSAFMGTWRRFDLLGTWHHSPVISDYAHHPTEILATIATARERYPHGRIVVIFQPHQRSRTKKLLERFVEALQHADLVILLEIYDVAGRERSEDADISSRDIVNALVARGVTAIYFQQHQDIFKHLSSLHTPDDIILVMGAGDIVHCAEELVK